MTIEEIIANAEGSAGSRRAWTVERTANTVELYHYSTLMLVWNPSNPRDESVLYYGIGHGSKSDQGGMNTAFRTLRLPLRFDRDRKGGGPRITKLYQS